MGSFRVKSEAAPNLDSTPTPPQVRKFTVWDGMVLIAATALIIAGGSKVFVALAEQCYWFGWTLLNYHNRPYTGRPDLWRRAIAAHGSTIYWYAFRLSETLLVSLAPAIVLFRLGKPRAPFRVMLRQPGAVASLGVIFGFVWVRGWLHRLFFGRFNDESVSAMAVGTTVAIAWAALALSRRWQAEPTWIDGMGRSLGVLAIAIGLFALIQYGI
jgi:hypothetical protein